MVKAVYSALSSLGNCCLIPGTELQNKHSAFEVVVAPQKWMMVEGQANKPPVKVDEQR